MVQTVVGRPLYEADPGDTQSSEHTSIKVRLVVPCLNQLMAAAEVCKVNHDHDDDGKLLLNLIKNNNGHSRVMMLI